MPAQHQPQLGEDGVAHRESRFADEADGDPHQVQDDDRQQFRPAGRQGRPFQQSGDLVIVPASYSIGTSGLWCCWQ